MIKKLFTRQLINAVSGKSLNYYRFAVIAILVFFVVFFSYSFSSAQNENPDAEPPPLKQISKGEKAQLAAITEVKQRTNLSLQLMSVRMSNAEKLLSEKAYPEMYNELGGFHALTENALDFLLKSGPTDGKLLNNLKKFEIGIRAFAPRLENIRRDCPERFEPYVKNLLKYLGQAREKAIAPFFGDTAVPNVRNN